MGSNLRQVRIGLVSEALQRSLLTDPSQSQHLQIAVRYRPAAAQVQVGGDWYDAFYDATGGTCLVVGDVTGHDRLAAAVMGQIRNLLRALGHTLGAPPGEVLTAVDTAIRDLRVDTLATALLAVVEQTPGQRASGVQTLRWSNAGHPPPLLVAPDGSSRLLTSEADLLLGIDPMTPRADHTVELQPGSIVVLYTDGLVERRGASLDEGLAWLVGATRGQAGLTPDQLCDLLLDGVARTAEDDIALLVMRVRP